jgi:hypothetical protein
MAGTIRERGVDGKWYDLDPATGVRTPFVEPAELEAEATSMFMSGGLQPHTAAEWEQVLPEVKENYRDAAYLRITGVDRLESKAGYGNPPL